MNSTCYDDPIKDRSGPVACQGSIVQIYYTISAKLPDTVNVAIQIEDTQVHERHATKQKDFDEKNVALYIIRNFDSYSVSFQTVISRIYSNETSVIQTLQYHHPIIHVQFNQLINYLDPRLEYIRVIIIEWSTKFSISIARTVSPDNQYSSRLLNARRCENFDD
ncbi:unnamed protein product [Rotaria socialis]|uniref:Uncharacterized protein n=1 Tax=Rotaria socialis TaxID=392032 RepID=A0A821V7T4_9BILA|nr:unnamed protein product [Rotaria socialis]